MTTRASLPLTKLDEHGVHFATGVPVEFTFIRNTVPAPKLGRRFQQGIEPAGRYLQHLHWDPGKLTVNWVTGRVRLSSPLVMEFNSLGGGYDKHSWKAILRKAFKAKGAALSRKLEAAGYDSIVTVRRGETPPELSTSEIVLLPKAIVANAEARMSSPTLTLVDAKHLGEQIGVDWPSALFTLAEFRDGVLVELEHSDVTGGDLQTTARIALAHLRECTDYYTRLAPVEKACTAAKPNPRPIPLDDAAIAQEVDAITARTVLELQRRGKPYEHLSTFEPPYYLWSDLAQFVTPLITVDRRKITLVVLRVVPVAAGSPGEIWVSAGAGHTSSGVPAIVLSLNGSFSNEELERFVQNNKHALSVLLRHELTHLADMPTHGEGTKHVKRAAEMTDADLRAYFNQPHEVRAYGRDVADQAVTWAKRMAPGKSGREALELAIVHGELRDIYRFLTSANQKRIIALAERAVRDAGVDTSGAGELPNPAPTTVQTLIFARDRWTPAQAKRWAKKHGFRSDKVDTQTNTLRLRQLDPADIERWGGTIPFGERTGIQAVVGVRRNPAPCGDACPCANPSPLKGMHRDYVASVREGERARKAVTRYAVVQHSSGPSGGYVVREGTLREDGSLYIPAPYTNATPLKVFKSKALAQRYADKTNEREEAEDNAFLQEEFEHCIGGYPGEDPSNFGPGDYVRERKRRNPTCPCSNPAPLEDANARARDVRYAAARGENVPYVTDVYSLCTADCSPKERFHVPDYKRCDRCGASIHKLIIELEHPEQGFMTVGSECVKDVMGWQWNKSHEQAWATQLALEAYLEAHGLPCAIVSKGKQKRLNVVSGNHLQWDGKRGDPGLLLAAQDSFRYSVGGVETPDGWPDRITHAGQDLGLPWIRLCRNEWLVWRRNIPQDGSWYWLTIGKNMRAEVRGGAADSPEQAGEMALADLRDFWQPKLQGGEPHDVLGLVYRVLVRDGAKCTEANLVIDPSASVTWSTYLRGPRPVEARNPVESPNPATFTKASRGLDVPAALKQVADRVHAAGIANRFGCSDVLAWMAGDEYRLGFRGPALRIENYVLLDERHMLGNRNHELEVRIQRAFGINASGSRNEGVTSDVGQRMDEGDTSIGTVFNAMDDFLSHVLGGEGRVSLLPDEGEPWFPGQEETPYYSARKRKVFAGHKPATTTVVKFEEWGENKGLLILPEKDSFYAVNPCAFSHRIDPGDSREVCGEFKDGTRIMVTHSFDPTMRDSEALKVCGGLLYPSLSLGPLPASSFGPCCLVSRLDPVLRVLKPYAEKRRGAYEVAVYDTDSWTGSTSDFAKEGAVVLWAQLSGNWAPTEYYGNHMWVLGPKIGVGFDDSASLVKSTKALRAMSKRIAATWHRGATKSEIDAAMERNAKLHYPYGEAKLHGVCSFDAFPLCICAQESVDACRTFLAAVGWHGELHALPLAYAGGYSAPALAYAWAVSDAVFDYAKRNDRLMMVRDA